MPRVAVHYSCTPRPFVLHVDTQEEAERLAERFRAYAGVRRIAVKAERPPAKRPRRPSVIRPRRPARPMIDQAAVIAFHDGGSKTTRECARQFGCSIQRVSQILLANDIKGRARDKLDGQRRELVDAYERLMLQGMTKAGACAELGVRPAGIDYACMRLGVGIPKDVRRAQRAEKIAAYMADNRHLTQGDIAKQFRVSPNEVGWALRLVGVATRKPGWRRGVPASQVVHQGAALP